MAYVDSPANLAFDNLSPSVGAVTASSAVAVTIVYSPLSSKDAVTLKLAGRFDEGGSAITVFSGSYTLPDATSATFFFPSGSGPARVENPASLRVDQFLLSLLAGDDWFTLGNQADAVSAGGGDDTVFAGGGADRIQGGVGSDFIDGGAGIDVAVFAGARSAYILDLVDHRFIVADQIGAEGRDTLTAVERLQFADRRLAIDLDGSAGTVVKLIGAVFGAKSVSNPAYVGIGLGLLDSGMGSAALAELAVAATGRTAPTDIVTLLWTNVVGTAPTTQQAQPFVDMLRTGTSVGALTLLAADTPLNAANVDLVGLAKSGVEYVLAPG